MGGWKKAVKAEPMPPRQPFGLYCRGAYAGRNTRKQRGRVCELLTSFPTCHLAGGWHEPAFSSLQWVFLWGPVTESQTVRTREQQVENYQELSSCSGHSFSFQWGEPCSLLQILQHEVAPVGPALRNTGAFVLQLFLVPFPPWLLSSKWSDTLFLGEQAMDTDINYC